MAYTDKQTPSQRYYIESPAPGLYEAHDVKSGVFVTFEDKQFKDTQEWHFPADPKLLHNEIAMNRLADGLEGFLVWHYPEIVGISQDYKVELSEDGETVTFTRFGNPDKPGDPRIVITFPAQTYKKTAASLIRNMARYLKDNADDWHRNF